MTAPTRLKESGSTFEANLLRAGRSERPRPDATRRAVAAASAVAVGSCAATTSTSGVISAANVPSWLTALAASAGVVGIGVAVIASSVMVRKPAAPTPIERAPVTLPVAEKAAPVETNVTTQSNDQPSPTAPSTVAPATRARRTTVVAPPPSAKPLAEPEPPAPTTPPEDELTLLRRAKASIKSHDGADALRTLDVHSRSYPSTRFAQEAAALHVAALVESGDGARARAAADEFLAQHPDSPYAESVRSAIRRLDH